MIQAVADLKAQELMGKRREVSEKVAESIKGKLASNHIVLEDLAITSLDFKKEAAKSDKQQEK